MRLKRINGFLACLAALGLLSVFVPHSAKAQPNTSYTGTIITLFGDPQPGSAEQGVSATYLIAEDGSKLAELAIHPSQVLPYLRQRVTVTGYATEIAPTLPEPNLPVIAPTQINLTDGTPQPEITGSYPYINLLCRFADVGTTPNPPSYYSTYNSASFPGVNHLWQQMSYGLLNLNGSGTASQWVNLPHPRSYYDMGLGYYHITNMARDCAAAADPFVNFDLYYGLNLFFNAIFGCCAWGGTATSVNVEGLERIMPATWIPTWAGQATLAHEVGHSFGLDHSSGPANNPPGGSSPIYVSNWDVMSRTGGTCAVSSSVGCVGPGTIGAYLDQLGWIPAQRKVTVPNGARQTITLEKLRVNSTNGMLLARVPIQNSTTEFYTVEVRALDGYDQNVPAQGVVIHYVKTNYTWNGIAGPALVVDGDGNNDVNDAGAVWLPGESFVDAARNIRMDVLSGSGTNYTVRISNNSNILLINGDFSEGQSPWYVYGSATSRVQNGVMEFFYNPALGSTRPAVLQNIPNSVAANTSMEAQFDLGNSSNIRRRALIIIHNNDFSDFRVCDFWLPPNTPLRRYTMSIFNYTAWNGFNIAFYDVLASATGYLRLDNVQVQFMPAGSTNRVDCIDPAAPPAGSGADSSEWIANGTFASGLSPWGWAGNISPNPPSTSGGVLQYFYPTTGTASVPTVLTNTGMTAPADAPLEVRLQLGNSSAQRKRILILLHDADFSDVRVCDFWLPANAPLQTYVMRTYTTKAWANVSLSLNNTNRTASGFMRVDNVSLHYRPSLDVEGSHCYEPTAAPADALRALAPTLEPTGTPANAAPISEPTLPPTATVLPDAAGEGAGEGG